MPSDDRLWPENCNRAEDGGEPTIEPNEQKAIGIAELWSLRYLPAERAYEWAGLDAVREIGSGDEWIGERSGEELVQQPLKGIFARPSGRCGSFEIDS